MFKKGIINCTLAIAIILGSMPFLYKGVKDIRASRAEKKDEETPEDDIQIELVEND
jgi:hypothetical protein